MKENKITEKIEKLKHACYANGEELVLLGIWRQFNNVSKNKNPLQPLD